LAISGRIHIGLAIVLFLSMSFSPYIYAVDENGPTDIVLSNQLLNENAGANAVVGILTAVDADQKNSYTYSLVSGNGDTDNALFTVARSTLRAVSSFNYENQTLYSVRVQVSDGQRVFAKPFQISIGDVNEAPTDIQLSKTHIAENGGSNATVAILSTVDPDANDSFSYSLVNGAGDNDNGAFHIQNNVLRTYNSLNFEAKSNFSVRIQVSDGQLTFEKPFALTVTNVNETPNDITLSTTTIAENSGSYALVGLLGATDPDAMSTFSFSFVDGRGDTDNYSFKIIDNQLLTATSLNYEAKSQLSIRVQVSDGILTYEEVFVITLTDVAEAPSDIVLQPASILENEAVNSIVGELSASDQDVGSQFSFLLASGPGDTDNDLFVLDSTNLRALQPFNYEQQSQYSIRLQVSDGLLTYEKALTVRVDDVNEAPTEITISDSEINENSGADAEVATLDASSPDFNDTFVYQLVDGVGAEDNDAFYVDGATLRARGSFDYEQRFSYSVRLRVVDGAFTFEQSFNIQVVDVNEAPTQLQLNASFLAENAPAGSEVATLSAADEDNGETFTYSLVAGIGSDDNALFSIDENRLLTKAPLNFEQTSRYSVRLEVADRQGLTLQSTFFVQIMDVNEAPSELKLSPFAVAENAGDLAIVGRLQAFDEDAGAVLQYTLTEGVGSQDNALFIIEGDTLKARQSFDFEKTPEWSIRIQVSDGSLVHEAPIAGTVIDVNEAPSDILLSNATIAENSLAQTVVGLFRATDEDAISSFSYEFISGPGDTDNASFLISDGQLKAKSSFNYEAKNRYSVRVSVSDGELSFAKLFVVNVIDVNETPNKPILSHLSIAENANANALVGTLSASDPDIGATLTFTFTQGAGDTDNAHFLIADNKLTAVKPFNFEAKSRYSVRIRVSDGMLSNVAVFAIVVKDVNEAPIDIVLSANTITEFLPASSVVGSLLATDVDVATKFSYALVSGVGSRDNSKFLLTGNVLKSRIPFDSNQKSVYNIRLRVIDNGMLYFEKPFTITVMPKQYRFEAYFSAFADNTFRPNNALTRAEVAALVMRLVNQSERKLVETQLRIDYLDIGVKSRHATLVSRVTRYNVMAGYPDGTFRPDRVITHREMKTVIMNYLTLMSVQNVGKAGNMFCRFCRTNYHLNEIRAYLDGRKLSGAPKVMSGNIVTRAEAVTLLNRLFHRGPIMNVSRSSWKDVPATHWAMRDIEAASIPHISTRRADDRETLVSIIKRQLP